MKLPVCVEPTPTKELVTDIVMGSPVMLNGLLVAEVRPVLLATRLYPVPGLLMLRLENVTTPFTALTVTDPPSVPEPGFVPIASVTEALEVVTVLPPASWIVTVTAGVIDAPAGVFDGCTLNVSFEAVPAVTLNAPLMAPVKPALEAVNV